jgi:hypothetical protein
VSLAGSSKIGVVSEMVSKLFAVVIGRDRGPVLPGRQGDRPPVTTSAGHVGDVPPASRAGVLDGVALPSGPRRRTVLDDIGDGDAELGAARARR